MYMCEVREALGIVASLGAAWWWPKAFGQSRVSLVQQLTGFLPILQLIKALPVSIQPSQYYYFYAHHIQV